MLTATDKLTARHRERRAYVYVRQSSPKQVRENTASQENQYGLVQRAIALGWPADRIQVIDADQAQSGQDGERPGFQELVAAVSLGRVGLVLAYEASRLARNNAAWYTLLDLAALRGTLIADPDGIYDPRQYNDRLLLGLRGMLSEAELHLLHLRLAEGRLRQVERGVYRQRLPTGLLRLEDGQVLKDPDQQIQHAIMLVFDRFAQLGSCQKVLRALRDDGVLLPRRQWSGLQAGQVVWRRPTESAIYEQVRNPAYAGAFVYGRHAPHPDRQPGQVRMVDRPLAEWTVIHQGVYPAYISWETFVANQERLTDNASSFARRLRGAPRHGAALLTGLVVCGRCGRQMRVAYKPAIRYLCCALNKTQAESACLNLDGAGIEAAVVQAFFEALASAELDLLEEVLAAQCAAHHQVVQQHAEQVARAEYEARLAEKQYLAIDPDNRLVAAELERRWELALRAVGEAREAAEWVAAQPAAPPLDPSLTEQLRDLGQQLPALWASGRLRPEQQKALLRTLIRRVVLTRPQRDTAEVKLVWVSGAVSALTVGLPVGRTVDKSDYAQLEAQVLHLSAAGYPAEVIAERLAEQGIRAARGGRIDPGRVNTVRNAAGQASLTHRFRTEDHIDGQWTVRGLARHLGVSWDWLYRRVRTGTVPAQRHPVSRHYLIPDDPALVARLAAACAGQQARQEG